MTTRRCLAQLHSSPTRLLLAALFCLNSLLHASAKTHLRATGNSYDPVNSQQALKDARSLWDSKNINYYTFKYKEGCHECYKRNFPWIIQDGIKGTRGVDTNMDDVTGQAPNMEGIFDKIEHAIVSKAFQVQVSYNDDFGFPTDIYLHYDPTNPNDQTTISVTDIVIQTSDASSEEQMQVYKLLMSHDLRKQQYEEGKKQQQQQQQSQNIAVATDSVTPPATTTTSGGSSSSITTLLKQMCDTMEELWVSLSFRLATLPKLIP